MEEKKVQLIRVVGDLLKTDITDEELKFRKSEYSNEKKILKKSLICTACGKDVKNRIISNYKINVHPVLEVIWCKKCEEFYDDGNFSTDEDGSDKYCRWCAQGGDLYCCSYCSVAFCAVCVKRNLPKKIFKELDDDDWRCFVCITNPLWSLRALCDAAKKYVDSHTKNVRKSRRKRSEDEDESEEEDENSETEATPRKSRRTTGKDLEMLVDSDDGVFKKQVDSHKKNARKSRRKKSENESEEEEEDKEEESSEIEILPLKSKGLTRKDLEMIIDSDDGVFKKQVDWHKKNVRKSCRKKSEDEDDSEEEEKREEENSETETTPRKSRRSSRKNLKVVVDSDDDDVSKEMKKSKRKHGSSNEERSVRNKRRKKNEDDEEEEVEKLEDPNEEKKQLLENLIIDTLNDCGALRKVISMKENSFKKLFLNTKSSEVNENIKLAEEKFSKLFFDSIESIKVIKKKFLNGTEILQKNAENSELTKRGENVSIINGNENESESASIHEHDDVNTSTSGANNHEDEPTEVVQDDDVTVENNLDVDITIENKVNDDSIEDSRVDDTSLEKSINENSIENNSDASVAENNNDSSIEKSNKDESAVESDLDAQKNDSIKDGDEEVKETSCANDMNGNTSPDDYCLTIAEDHIEKNDSHSINDSLAVNASSTIDSITTDDFLSQSLNSSQANKTLDQTTSNNDGIQENGNVVDENDEDKIIERPNKFDKEKVAKLALLQSSSDNETVQQKSSESDLSGVSVLNSDTEETKMKKKKTRKELNKLRGSVKNDSDDDDDHLDKIVNRLTDLGSLKNKKQMIEEDEDETEKESGEENDVKNSSKKKTLKENNKNTSLMKYFSDGDKSDASDISFSKLNSFIENKNKAYLEGKEELSKKMLLDFSSEEENEEKCDEQKSKKESNVDAKKPQKKESEIIDLDSDGEKNQRKSKPSWKNDPLLTEKLSKTDTSDDERSSVRDGKKKQKQRKGWDSKSNSDSEDLFLPKKKEAAKKKRKTRISSSDTDFDAKDDNKSTEVSSEEEVPKNKKRKRIKNFNDSNSSDDEVAEMNQSQGSASKGRKNIRKMLHEEDLAEITRKTAKEEEERKKRISERQALFNESFNLNIQQNQFLTKLVLDFDPKTKEELIVVHPSLIVKLKPHQAKGVKFMWDSCFESLEMTKTSPGNGCILAHCMGLGKTLQVIALIHTVMRYSELNVKRVLIICPLSTVLNWVAEFDQWLKDVEYGDDIDVYYLVKSQNNVARADYLNNWFRKGGVMVLGYEMFRNLINTTKVKNRIKQYFIESLLDPGPDLVVCDEGHMLKNESSALSQAAMKIKTRRRIVLTGTPLQNNLKEYHCMVQFVKPNLLGDKKEFLNRFANPITNGQYSNSTSHDVRVMKRRAHVLHKMLDGTVQRFDYNVLTPFLPAKHEFVILVGLSDLQATLYQHYIDNFSKKVKPADTSLFKDYQIMRLIWTHPYAMKLSEDRKKKTDDKKFETDSEGSLKDFVVHTDESSSSDSDDECSDKSDKSVISITSEKSVKNRLTRAKKKELGIADEELEKDVNLVNFKEAWWRQFVSDEQMEDFKMGPKIVLLFAILRQCEEIGDKVLVFSQSIPSLDMIEYFLQKWESSEETKNDRDYLGTWDKGVDYFRLDGQTPSDLRSAYCNKFNRTNNLRSRLFLISTKAGGLGINLTAANRVIIFDASWNPSYDVQSIFRIYRFGQTKPCYIYRFLSQGTMEEKIYERQVTKLSISCRVVDEQQIDRHFNNTDIVALYEFNRLTPSLDVPKLPKDRLMAELLKEYKQYIVKYHEHDSLLENVVEEELTEEERKQAWEDYENEKKGVVNASVNMSSQLLINAQAEAMFDRNVILNALRIQYPTVVGPQLQIMYNMVCNELRQKYVQQIQMQMASTQKQNDKVNPPVADVQKQSLVRSGEPVSDPHLRKALETLPTNVEQIAIQNGSTSQE